MGDVPARFPCAKKLVVCVIVQDGRVIGVGNNNIRHQQKVCPRLPGEGYEKCVTTCDQPGHAEEMAVMDATKKGHTELDGSTAYIHGIGHICGKCQGMLGRLGIMGVLTQPNIL